MDFDANSRRRHQRRSTQIVFRIEKLTDSKDQPVVVPITHMLIVDVSASGARFEANHSIPEQASIQGHFELPGDTAPIVCECMVLRTNSPRSRTGMRYTFAVEFTALSDADRKRIEEYVHSGGFVI